MKKKKLLFLLPLFLCLGSCTSTTDVSIEGGDHDPFDFEGNYVNPELTIDGIKDEEAWDSEWACKAASFGYTYQENRYTVDIYLYRGELELCAFFEVTDCNILTDGNDNGNSVSYSDSVEIYFDTLNNGGDTPQLDDYQINLGVHGKTRILSGTGSGWSQWSGLVQFESVINGTLNDPRDVDTGYTVEMAIPYKQIGIQRDTEIGIAFGLVNKFDEGGGSAYKTWYGQTLEGNFVNPQKPDTYLDYHKAEVVVPPTPTYYVENDTTVYNEGVATLPSNGVGEETYGNIRIDVARTIENEFVFRLKVSEGTFNTNFPIWIYFDAQDRSVTTRDTTTYQSWCMRINPVSGKITSFFFLMSGDPKISTTTVKVKISEEYLYINIPLNIINSNVFSSRDLGFAVVTAYSSKIFKEMTFENSEVNTSNPSTFIRVTKNNAIIYPDSVKYSESLDNTNYINDLLFYSPQVSNSGKVDALISRENNIFTVKLTKETAWADEDRIWLYFDGVNPAAAKRDNTTAYSMRITPIKRSIDSFFRISDSYQLDKSLVTIKNNTNVLFVQFAIEDYYPSIADGDFAFTFGQAYYDASTAKVSWVVDSNALLKGVKTDTGSPATWAQMCADNTVK
ncbi:MAG: sugar-binding protein [Bacilli bacterium]